MTISNDLNLLIEGYRYELRYVDYSENEFTAPVILTKERAAKIMDDNSITEVRFTPIIGDSGNFTFKKEYLYFNPIIHEIQGQQIQDRANQKEESKVGKCSTIQSKKQV